MPGRVFKAPSVTLPRGIHFPTKGPRLNALLVVCHGWRSRAARQARSCGSAGWVHPLARWTRPMRRAA